MEVNEMPPMSFSTVWIGARTAGTSTSSWTQEFQVFSIFFLKNKQTIIYRQALGIASWQEEEVFDGGGVRWVAVEQQRWEQRWRRHGDRSRGHACGGRSCDSASVAGTVLSVGGSVRVGAVAQRNSGKTRNKTKRKKITHRCPVSERACDKEFFFSFFFFLIN